MIKKPTEVWEKKVQDAFKRKDKSKEQLFLDVVSVILFANKEARELGDLYSLLSLEDFIRVINLFENRTIKFPTKKAIKEAIELALFYYHKEIRGVDSYKELKKMGIVEEQEFSSKSIGRRISQINKTLLEEMNQILSRVEEE